MWETGIFGEKRWCKSSFYVGWDYWSNVDKIYKNLEFHEVGGIIFEKVNASCQISVVLLYTV